MRHLIDGPCAKPGVWSRPGRRTSAYSRLDFFVYRGVSDPPLDS